MDCGTPAICMAWLTLAPVHAVGVRPLHAVDGTTDVVSVVRLFRAERCTQVLVRGAGSSGGRIVASGPPEQLTTAADSRTGAYLQRFFAGAASDGR